MKRILKSDFSIQRKCEAFFTGRQVEVTKDGNYMFCQCTDGVSYVKIDTGEVIKKISTEEDEISCISLSPNNSTLVLALRSSSIQQYEYTDSCECPQLVRSFKSYHQGPVRCMAWDSTSTLLASGSSDGTARIWDLHQKFCTHSLKGASGVFSVLRFDILKERPRIFGACASDIFIWKLEASSSSIVATLKSHNSPITGMELSVSQQKLVSCGLDRVVILWDLNDFMPMKIIPTYESLSGLVLSPPGESFFNYGSENDEKNGIYVMVVGDKGIPSLWEVCSGKELWKASAPLVPPTDQEGVTLVTQFVPVVARRSLLFATYDNSILFSDYKSMTVWKQFSGFNEQIVDVTFVGEDNSHLVVATNSPQLRIYNAITLDCKLLRGHNGIIMALARHPLYLDIFASSSTDNNARVWRLLPDGSAVTVAVASGHTHSIGSIVFSDDFLVTGSKDTCIKKWLFDAKVVKSLKSFNAVNLMCSLTEKVHNKDINTIAISRNSTLIATGSQDKTAKIFECKDFSVLAVLEGHRRGIWCCQFSPVDQILATGSADGTIKIWTLSTFVNAMTLEGHQVSVLRLHFITNGLQIISSGTDGLLKLWNLKNGLCVNTFDGHDDKVWALAISDGGGNQIVSGGEDASLIWWKDVTEEEKTKKSDEQQQLLSQEQKLLNLVHDKKWLGAFKIAISLSQPYRALGITKQILDECPENFPAILGKLEEHELVLLLEFIAQWNTKAKDTREAQTILYFLLKEKTPSELECLAGFGKALEGLISYTERHFKRAQVLHQGSQIASYIIRCRGMPATVPFG